MIKEKTLCALEYDSILKSVSKHAVLEQTKLTIKNFKPVSKLLEAKFLLEKTREAYDLIYTFNAPSVYFFSDINEELNRANMGGTLNNAEILRVNSCLKSARITKTFIQSITDERIVILTEIASRLYVDKALEEEIDRIIISEDEISDNASVKLYSIRKSIRNLNAKIRERLNSYIRGKSNVFLQDSVVTMRQDRFVIPVKSEYRSSIKGFIHDQSSTGATVFIEPEIVIELNNQLKSELLAEADEINRILAELSSKIASISNLIGYNVENLVEIDQAYAKAYYSFENRCSCPSLNDKGYFNIKRGRHPLISKDKVVPVTLSFGEKFKFLLLTGLNTGGKTVTMKMVGLFSLMAMSGIFIPADDDTCISVYNNIFCDIGDEQSIENNLSTFSSHVNNLINIYDNCNGSSLVLIDEIGGGTNPEEGCAIALAYIENLLKKDCQGIITTHYSALKEYAAKSALIENASMEFDSKTLKPLYKINIGIPGSSNAINIAKSLGLNEKIIEDALKNLSGGQQHFENVIKLAEDSRREYEKISTEIEQIKNLKQQELDKISIEREKITKERERIYFNARQETKRIVADKLSEAEEIIDELKDILKRANLESKEVFRAGELRNRLANSKYLTNESSLEPYELNKVEDKLLVVGNRVYVKSLGCYGIINKIKKDKKEVEVSVGSLKSVVKASDLFNSEKVSVEKEKGVKINRQINFLPSSELYVLGKTSLEAITELEKFIDQAVVNNLEEIKVIHGVGEGILLKEIRNYLKKDKRVLEFRRGKYGEGENGVTIIKLK